MARMLKTKNWKFGWRTLLWAKRFTLLMDRVVPTRKWSPPSVGRKIRMFLRWHPRILYLLWFYRRVASGWAESSYFYVLVQGVEYLRGTLSGLPRKELTLYRKSKLEQWCVVRYMIPADSLWRYTIVDPLNPGWSQSLPAWSSYYTGSFPAVSSTRYFVQSVTISTAFQSQPILEVDVYTHEGFILYVNGVEVNRFNLPT